MIPFTMIIKMEQAKIYNHSTYTLLIQYKKNFTFFFTVYKNEQKDSKFQRQKNQKSDFYKNKKVFQIDYIDVNNVLVSKKEAYGTKKSFKYFIEYNDNDVIRSLLVKLPQMTGYARKFNENKTMSFRVNNKQLLKNYNKIWKKGDKLLNINFESRPVYDNNDKYIKTKIKIYADGIITNFHKNKIPKEKAPCKCLSIIMLDSVIKTNKKYYPQILLEECK